MSKKALVIVESPSKAKTINKFLGANYVVKASVGHIRDLPTKDIGVDIENGFKPEYVSIDRQKKVIKDLKTHAKTCDDIYIATDPDREGEAIAWHIAHEVGKNKNIHRAMFNEITEKAVIKAIENPLSIDLDMVDAQQARRVLDRLVGYKVSPLLWKSLYRGSLSAGRVQSVALRLICAREVEHLSFKPEEYWDIKVDLLTDKNEHLTAMLKRQNGKKISIPNKEASDGIIKEFKQENFSIASIDKKKVSRNPSPPFITSTIQQEAANKIGFAPSKTMKIAQELYEGVELGSEGSVSLITYMRTDSFRMSDEALTSVREFINTKYGDKYLPPKPRVHIKKKSKGNIQDAHECIRPTYFSRPYDEIKSYLTADQAKLYSLIWNRSVASQMENAISNQTQVKIDAGDYQFLASGSEPVFDGFLVLWQEAKTDDNGEEENSLIPKGLNVDTKLNLDKVDPKQHFTKPPPRFTDSSLVKELDQLGIGRPSTYAQIIFTLVNRTYVNREKRTLTPTPLGITVNKIVVSEFPDIFNVDFTANMESELDQIESGSKKYEKVIADFYKPFNADLENALARTAEIKKSLEEPTDKTCPECKNPIIKKWSKNGQFFACTGYPECKHTEPLDGEKKVEAEKTDLKCEKCGSEMVIKTGRFGKFTACSNYPACKNILKDGKTAKEPPEKSGFDCDKCGKEMVVRNSKRGKFHACSGFPKCRNTKAIKEDKEEAKPKEKAAE